MELYAARLGMVNPFLLCISACVSNLLRNSLHSFQFGSLFSTFGGLYFVTQSSSDQHMVSSCSFFGVAAVGGGGGISGLGVS